MNSSTPGVNNLGQATVRELIVQLALAEDEHRNTTNPRRIADLTRREQAIVVALQRNGLGPTGPDNPRPPGPSIAASVEELVVR